MKKGSITRRLGERGADVGGIVDEVIEHPEHIGDLVEALKVEKAKYQRHGELSPECRNVALGHAIDSFDELFDQIDDKAAVLRFVKRQLRNTRKPVVKKAERFLQRHGALENGKARGPLNRRKARETGRPRRRQ
jgi:hypothetical protein